MKFVKDLNICLSWDSDICSGDPKSFLFVSHPAKKTPFQSNNNQLVIHKFSVIIQGFADDFAHWTRTIWVNGQRDQSCVRPDTGFDFQSPTRTQCMKTRDHQQTGIYVGTRPSWHLIPVDTSGGKSSRLSFFFCMATDCTSTNRQLIILFSFNYFCTLPFTVITATFPWRSSSPAPPPASEVFQPLPVSGEP